jgi:hypothetical protein
VVVGVVGLAEEEQHQELVQVVVQVVVLVVELNYGFLRLP